MHYALLFSIFRFCGSSGALLNRHRYASSVVGMGCSSSQIDALTNDNNSRSEVEGGGGDDATQFVAIERDGTSMSTFTRQVPGREISFMSPGDMQIVAATVNRKYHC